MGEVVIEVERVRERVFADGSPVRSASGVARVAGGWLVVQDDGTHAALVLDPDTLVIADPDGPIEPITPTAP